MKLAVIETGGRQYVVSEGKKIEVEKLPQKAGDKFDFEKVLLVSEDGKVDIGNPNISGKKVSAELVEQTRREKIKIFRYHSKTRRRRKKGHRQEVSIVKILEIK